MKKILSTILTSLICLQINAQETTHYSDGLTQFEADASYASGTDWHELFADYHPEMYNYPIGKYRKIIVDEKGNIFMTQKTNHTIYKFSPTGHKIKNIGSHGSGKGQFPMLPSVKGIIDGKYIYTTDVQGRIRIFNLNGTFYKSAQIDYMPLESVPLKNNMIAILGHVPMGGGDVRNVITIKDINTGKETTIWKKDKSFEKSNSKTIIVDLEDKGMISFGQLFSNPKFFRPQISATRDGNLLVGFPRTGIIEVYSSSGQKLKSFELDIEVLQITEADKLDYYESALAKAKEIESSIKKNKRYNESEKKKMIEGYYEGVEMLKDPHYYPPNLPYFAEILVDDQNNLWVVKYSKMEASESFQLYSFSEDGKYLGTSTVQCNNYKIVLNPDQIQFHNGGVIALVLDKNDKEIPIRLAKFKLH
ncbi:MAG: 6-bladed beta-propeller [Salinivirgaceae bacterium]